MEKEKYKWLFNEVEGTVVGLGEAEREIPSNDDRWAIAQEIPHGWRLVKTKAGGWAFSRFMSYSVQSRVVNLHAAAVQ